MANCQQCEFQLPNPPPPAPEYILNGNHPLQPSEADVIRERIEASKSARAVLDTRWKRLQNDIKALENARVDLDNYVTRHEPLLASSRSVPPEIWGEVFQTAQANFELSNHPTLSPGSPCVQLSHVCRSWRNISIQCPNLWSRIKDPLNTAFSQSNGLLILDVWLTRSYGSPLDISVRLADLSLSVEARVVNLLLAHSYHWQRADIQLSKDLLQSAAFKIKTAPVLESLTLSSIGVFGDKPHHPEIVELGSVRALRNITLYNVVPTSHVLHHLPWQSVESAHIFGLLSRTLDVKGLLSRCTSLSHFGFSGSVDQSTEVRHDGLKSLRISGGHSILTPLTAPALRRLELSEMRIEHAPVVEHFIAGCHDLREIILYCDYSGHSDISTLGDIESMTNWTVEKIKVHQYLTTESLVAFVAKLASGKGKYLPKLLSLELHFEIDAYDFDANIEVEALRLRDAVLDLCRQIKATRESRNEASLPRLNEIILEVTLDNYHEEETALVRQAYTMLLDMNLEGLDLKLYGPGWRVD